MVDHDEESERVHIECKREYESEHCPVCQRIVGTQTDIKIDPKIREQLKDKIYTPGEEITEDDLKLTPDEEAHRKFLEELLEGKHEEAWDDGSQTDAGLALVEEEETEEETEDD